MKKVFVVCFLSMLCAGLFAAPLKQGSFEIRGDASYTSDDVTIPIDGGLGYFVMDDVQVGGMVSFVKKNWGSYWGIADVWGVWGFVEKDFTQWSKTFVPYADLALGVMEGDRPWNGNVFVSKVSAGAKYLLNQRTAIAAQVNFNWAADDIYNFNRVNDTTGSGDSTDFSFDVGVRFFF